MTRECASVWDAEQTSASVSGMYRRPVCVFTRDVAQTTARVTSSWIIYSRLLPPLASVPAETKRYWLLPLRDQTPLAGGSVNRKTPIEKWLRGLRRAVEQKAEGAKQGVNKCAVWISIQFGKTSRQSTFPLSLSKSQFVDEEIQRHTVIRPIFWCLLDILDMLASWYEFIAYTLQKAARVANTDPRKRLEQHVIFRLS